MKIVLRSVLGSINRIAKVPILSLIQGEPIFVFHHVPKCAGSSIQQMLNKDFIHREGYYNFKDDFHKGEYDVSDGDKFLKSLKPFHYLNGHFVDPLLSTLYPNIFDNKRYKIFTFLREPLAQRVSWYYFSIRHLYPSVSLEYFLLNPQEFPQYTYQYILEVDSTNFKEKLDRYVFIGLVERLEESLKVLRMYLKRPLKTEVPHRNKGQKTTEVENISEELKLVFHRKNQLEYDIYNYASNRLDYNL